MWVVCSVFLPFELSLIFYFCVFVGSHGVCVEGIFYFYWNRDSKVLYWRKFWFLLIESFVEESFNFLLKVLIFIEVDILKFCFGESFDFYKNMECGQSIDSVIYFTRYMFMQRFNVIEF